MIIGGWGKTTTKLDSRKKKWKGGRDEEDTSFQQQQNYTGDFRFSRRRECGDSTEKEELAKVEVKNEKREQWTCMRTEKGEVGKGWGREQSEQTKKCEGKSEK